MDARAIEIYQDSVKAFYRFFTYLPENLSEMNENSDPDWNTTDELIEHGCTPKEIEEIDAYYKETLFGMMYDETTGGCVFPFDNRGERLKGKHHGQ